MMLTVGLKGRSQYLKESKFVEVFGLLRPHQFRSPSFEWPPLKDSISPRERILY